MPFMNDPRGRQSGFNAASRDQWGAFAGHRGHVSGLLGAAGGRLCVFGAGNGNDLDLPGLLTACGEVHLVDLDAEALAGGAGRQGVVAHPGLRLYGGLDVTGVLSAFAGWSPGTEVGPVDLEAVVLAPERLVAPGLPGPFDVVASTCLLSQLIGNAFHSIGEGNPGFLPLVGAIRLGHLRLLTGLVRPGGEVVLVTDLVSSDTLPGLAAMPEQALPGLLPGLIRDRNFFHGVNPVAVEAVFRDDPMLNGRVIGREWVGPWRWNLHDRVYLVVALRCRIRSGR